MKRNSSKTADNSVKRRDGFTLVELVVVIAVLAILAGVGAVAYRGYINHAKKAGDLELLSAVNDAFSSACIEYEIDRNKLPNGGASVETNEDKNIITGIDYVDPTDVPDDYKLVDFNNDFNAEFLYVFEPNNEIAMQYYKTDQIQFDGKEHMFVFKENAKLASGGIFKDSSFAGKDVGAVSQSTKWGSDLIESLLKYDNDNEKNSRKALTDALRGARNGDLKTKVNAFFTGLKGSGEFTDMFDSVFKNVKPEDLVTSLQGVGVSDNPSYTEMMNGMILLSAKQAVSGTNVDDYINAMKEDKSVKPGTTYPLLLGQLTAYYNSEQGQKDEAFKKQYNALFQIGISPETNNPYTGGISGSILGNLMFIGDSDFDAVSKGWEEYCKSTQAATDAQAYAKALEALTSDENKGNVDLSSPDMFGDFLRTLQ